MHQMIRNFAAMVAAMILLNLGACTFGVGNDDGNVGDASINGDSNNVPDRPAPNCVPRLEVCNGYDDDCDGVVDNNIASQEATPDCVSSAGRNAVMVCINGGWQCQAPMSEQPDGGRPPVDSGMPSGESCVNGYAPEVCTTGATSTALAQCDTFCTRQCGEGSARHLSCGSNSRWSCICDSTPTPTPDAGTSTDSGSPSGETCIDGHAPATCTPGATSVTLAMCDSFCTTRCGASTPRHLYCGAMAMWNCWCDGTATDAGVTPTPDASVPTCIAREEIFNGMDDDCDGLVDEGTTRSPQSACISSCAGTGRYADRENYTGASNWYCACGGLIPTTDAGVTTDSGTSPAGSRFVYEVRLADRWLPGLIHISLRDKWYGEIPCEEGTSGGFRMAAIGGNWYRCTTTVRLPAFTVAFWHDGRTSCTETNSCSTSPTFSAPVNCNNVEGTYRVYELRPAPDGRRFDIFTDASQPVRERVDGFCRHRDTGAGPL